MIMMKTTRNRPSLRYCRPRPKLTSSSTKPTSEGTYLQYIVVQKYGMPCSSVSVSAVDQSSCRKRQPIVWDEPSCKWHILSLLLGPLYFNACLKIKSLVNKFNKRDQLLRVFWWILTKHYLMVPYDLQVPAFTSCDWQSYFEVVCNFDACQCNHDGSLFKLAAQHSVIALHQRLSNILGYACTHVGRDCLLNFEENDVLHARFLKCKLSIGNSVYSYQCGIPTQTHFSYGNNVVGFVFTVSH